MVEGAAFEWGRVCGEAYLRAVSGAVAWELGGNPHRRASPRPRDRTQGLAVRGSVPAPTLHPLGDRTLTSHLPE